ncbi:MAG: peptide-methionine (R)-S-oxide reductase MsrB [Gammaproteobacteria bacterium]|nr:peptide-methionine (R)-S-oxide reductase MsrB [Gammaproteobacteria bacterium]NIR81751.1 peptide-methionine (R)-S-oxide reductase MsrB [Gammaproteobacteria bacterium]NIR88554.1 peptide-methionine (R)-S-oxide reductase MsrB [Gammaproteobacteria bacterium]NIU02858.1 peptide-methionine (R)-S-oxide reductase MsrB [Gammaproteobacteria bacterium]NIV50380.1 peptide-methionine (R)-S-oxide reductase MsrB [Gammaproteobacteria bacterium]
MTDKIRKSDEGWRAQLTPEAYQVTRERGTEEPFTGPYLHCETHGRYACVCCGQPLFGSDDKFDSGTGWPSFVRPLAEEAVATQIDRRFGKVRTEVLCSHCDAHLGHVYQDGPQPTGLRYCINSVALKLEPDGPEGE